MIKKIEIDGFQSHIKTTLELSEGLTVITGPSGSGKTSILRLVKWLAFNDPAGEAFINEKAGEAIGVIHLDTGEIITKRRRKGKTSYLIQQDAEDEGSLYEKSEVPAEVTRLLQIEKQTFGDFEAALNFAFQLDPPFLLSETASAGAKILGKLAGTESVDLAIKGISKDTYGSRQDRTNAEKDIERISGSMLAYNGIDAAKEAVEVAEMLIEQLENGSKNLDDLKSYLRTYEAAKDLLQSAGNKLDKLAHVPQLAEDLQDIEQSQARYDKLATLYAGYDAQLDRLTAINKKLQDFEGVELAARVVEQVEQDALQLSTMLTASMNYDIQAENRQKSAATVDALKELENVDATIMQVETDFGRLSELRVMKVNYHMEENAQKDRLERLKAFNELGEAEDLLGTLDTNLERMAAMQRLNGSYGELHLNSIGAGHLVQTAENELLMSKAEEAEAWEEAGGICPLCKQPHERGTC